MTQLRHCKCGISNYFDRVLKGLGKRGSSFSDIDAISHDRDTHRFLIQEFKREGEELTTGQHWMLKDLAAIPGHFTVWQIVSRNDGMIGFAIYGDAITVIGVDEYQRRFSAWWHMRADSEVPKPKPIETVARPNEADPRAVSAARMTNEQLVAYLDFVRGTVETDSDRLWLVVLENELRERRLVSEF